MGTHIPDIFEQNRKWAKSVKEKDPDYFERLARIQTPEILWIGCSDSRVPANQICGLDPGEVFVHRNVANVVTHTDFNCLSVLQYAVEVLKVKRVIVCGHYGCGGVNAALSDGSFGLIDNWLRHIKDVYYENRAIIKEVKDLAAQQALLAECNVKSQVANVCYTTIVQDAWRRGQSLTVHGWIYDVREGLLKDLGVTVDSAEKLPLAYQMDLT